MSTKTKKTISANGMEVDGSLPQSDGSLPSKVMRLERLKEVQVQIPIIGVTPLIPHRWSEKALNGLRQKQYGNKVRSAREPKNPEEDANQSCYWIEEGIPGMPATAFKAAIVDATRFFEGMTAVMAKQLFWVLGRGPDQLVQIEGAPVLFEATPRNSGGTVDLRYRMKISPWSAVLAIKFVPSQIDVESVVSLVDAAGRGGVGDWRPSAPKSKTGTFGTFRVDEAEV
jgi:hypothetical protein